MLGQKSSFYDRLLNQPHEKEGAQRLLIGNDCQKSVVRGCRIEAEVFLKEVIAVLLDQALPILLFNDLKVFFKRYFWLL